MAIDLRRVNPAAYWEAAVASKEAAALYLREAADESESEPIAETIAYWAARHGKLKVLKWLREEEGIDLLPGRRYNNRGYGQRVPADGASDGGSVECMEYFMKIGYQLEGFEGSVQFRHAASGGHLGFLKHFHLKGYNLADSFMMSDAAKHGHLQVIKFLHEIGTAWSEFTCQSAAEAGHLDILKYAHENGCPWNRKRGSTYNQHVCCAAAKGGNLACLEFIHEKNACELDSYAAELAAGGGHFDCVKYLHENGVDISSSWTRQAAQKGGNKDCIRYVEANKHIKCKRDLGKELLEAVQSKHCDLIQRLVNEGADIHGDFEGDSILNYIAKNDRYWDAKLVTLLIDLGADVSAGSSCTTTPLHKASLHGKVDLVRALLDLGADIEAQDKYKKQTPLHLAACSDQIEVIDLLLSRGANLEAKTDSGFTPLFETVEGGYLESTRKLLDHGASVNDTTEAGWTPISWAHRSWRCPIEIIDLLLDRGAVADPLFLRSVCKSSDTALLLRLLDNGADIHTRTSDGETLAHAVTDVKVLTILLDRDPELLHSTDSMGRGLIHSAGSIEVLSYLAHGQEPQNAKNTCELDVNARDNSGLTPLHVYAKEREPQYITKLLQYGAEVGAMDNFGRTALHIACERLEDEVIRALLNKGADVNCQDNAGNTPLHTVCYNYQKTYHISIVELLLNHRADMGIKNARGQTPLHIGCRSRKDNFVELMLLRGADVDIQDDTGSTPLHLASKAPPLHYTNCVGIFLRHGAEVLIRDHGQAQRMPIHVACENNVRQAYDQLLNHSAAVLMAKDERGRTPLHIACKNGNLDLARRLLSKGASTSEIDISGNTPFHYACFCGHWDVALFFARREGSTALALTNDSDRSAGYSILCRDGAPLDILYLSIREIWPTLVAMGDSRKRKAH